MRMTRFTDYSLRVLIYLGAHPGKICSIAEIAKSYGISQNHLVKVVQGLRKMAYVKSVRGRAGGILLAHPPEKINVGALVRQTEDDFRLVDCAGCPIAPACELVDALHQALAAFMAVLDGHTLDDLVRSRTELGRLLGAGPAWDRA